MNDNKNDNSNHWQHFFFSTPAHSTRNHLNYQLQRGHYGFIYPVTLPQLYISSSIWFLWFFFLFCYATSYLYSCSVSFFLGFAISYLYNCPVFYLFLLCYLFPFSLLLVLSLTACLRVHSPSEFPAVTFFLWEIFLRCAQSSRE